MAVSRFSRMPVFLSLESKVSGLKKLMSQAQNTAVCRGINTKLIFDAEKHCFYILSAPGTDSGNDSEAEEGTDLEAVSELNLPEEIKLKVNDEVLDDGSGKNQLFNFFPDGTGSGKRVILQFGKHAFRITVSPLSGSIAEEELKAVE